MWRGTYPRNWKNKNRERAAKHSRVEATQKKELEMQSHFFSHSLHSFPKPFKSQHFLSFTTSLISSSIFPPPTPRCNLKLPPRFQFTNILRSTTVISWTYLQLHFIQFNASNLFSFSYRDSFVLPRMTLLPKIPILNANWQHRMCLLMMHPWQFWSLCCSPRSSHFKMLFRQLLLLILLLVWIQFLYLEMSVT